MICSWDPQSFAATRVTLLKGGLEFGEGFFD